MNTTNKLQEYKEFWWMFDPSNRVWVVSDNKDISIATLARYHEKFLITECFTLFKELQNEYRERV